MKSAKSNSFNSLVIMGGKVKKNYRSRIKNEIQARLKSSRKAEKIFRQPYLDIPIAIQENQCSISSYLSNRLDNQSSDEYSDCEAYSLEEENLIFVRCSRTERNEQLEELKDYCRQVNYQRHLSIPLLII